MKTLLVLNIKALVVTIALVAFCEPGYASIRYVSNSAELQPALDGAVGGDTIILRAGVTFTGSFVLPAKSGTSWITIESSAMSNLPDGRRVRPSDSIHMPKLIAHKAVPALYTAAGAHHYRIRGVEFGTVAGVFNYDVVRLGKGTETSVTQLPYQIELDRVYIHGDSHVGGKRGIALNSRSTTVKNSYISDFKSTSLDTQAICGWNGPGPFLIANNYLEAAGENVMFGGGLPTITNLVPSDITIRGNHFFKPLTWRRASPTFAGTAWVVKNLLEFKNARRVLIEGNVLENNWLHAQNGYAILLTPRTEGGRAPWVVVEDITFTKNILRHTGAGFNICGQDGTYGGATRRVLIKNNVFEDIHSSWGNWGDFALVANDSQYITFDHNTIFHKRIIVFFSGAPTTGFVYKNNVSTHGLGLAGNGKGSGIPALDAFAPGYIVQKNVMAGGSSRLYPATNFFPASLNDILVTILSGGFLQAAAAPNPPILGTDGKNVGADLSAVATATANAVQTQ